MSKRSLAREKALQVLYEWEILGKAEPPRLEKDVPEYTRKLIEGVIKHETEINEAIKKVVLNWTIDRMAFIDRAILRLAAYEIIYCPDIPKAVAIDEAVELAKKYSTLEAARFINGILDKIQKPTLPLQDSLKKM